MNNHAMNYLYSYSYTSFYYGSVETLIVLRTEHSG